MAACLTVAPLQSSCAAPGNVLKTKFQSFAKAHMNRQFEDNSKIGSLFCVGTE